MIDTVTHGQADAWDMPPTGKPHQFFPAVLFVQTGKGLKFDPFPVPVLFLHRRRQGSIKKGDAISLMEYGFCFKKAAGVRKP